MNELHVLLVSAITLGFVHTILGPDHYLPFIVLSKARNWSRAKTMWITFFSGIGHIVGSVVLGIVGVALGISLSKLESIEAMRGDLAAWMLIVFGVIYSVYGIYKLFNNRLHSHLPNFLLPKSIRPYRHLPTEEIKKESKKEINITPWILFLIFVFGPCEVLIPLLIYPAAQHDTWGIVSVAGLFGAATITTMLVAVFIGYTGISFVRFKKAGKFFHLFAGAVILLMGLGIQFLGF